MGSSLTVSARLSFKSSSGLTTVVRLETARCFQALPLYRHPPSICRQSRAGDPIPRTTEISLRRSARRRNAHRTD
eukprot:3557342-Pleurochrysis_carterae.AAC.1